ncbi:MAG: oligosaccharide flippase family protein [Candidatus Marinimicrobia bacterium]|nr:oligosaccharide flippase family protein [Candidatus Neomarinimicrobiota bacterium]
MGIRTEVKDVGKQTIIYGIGRVAVKLTALMLIPVYTNYISIQEIGILALFELSEVILLALIPMGIFQGIWRYLTKSDYNHNKQIVISGFFGLIITTILLIGACFLGINQLMGFLNINIQYKSLYAIVFLNVAFQIGIQFNLQLLRYEQKSIQYSIITFLQFVGITGVTILLIIKFNFGLASAVWGKAIILAPLFIISMIYVFIHNRIKPSISVFLKQIKFGLPLIVAGVSTPILAVSDRYFLNLFLPLEQVGIYNIVYKFGMIINILLVMPLSMGISPYMYRIGSLNKEHKFFTDIMFYYAVLGSLIVLIFSIAAHPMIEFFSTKDYLIAAGIVPIISFAYLISGFRTFFSIGIALNNKTKIVGLIASAGIIINLLLNYILIKKYLLMGAAWATVISYMVITLMYYIAAGRIAKIDWGVPRLIKLMINLLIAICFVYINSHYHYYSQLIGGTLIIVLFIFLLIISNTISSRDINGIKYLLKKIFTLQ